MNFLANCMLFTRLLRQAGMPVSFEQAIQFVQALEWIEIGEREQVYHTARSLLVTRQEHLRIFDMVFNRFWRHWPEQSLPTRQTMPIAPRHKKREPFTIVSLMAARAKQSDPEIDVRDKAQTFSSTEVLQRKSFAELTPEELAAVQQLMQRMVWQISERRTRRRTADRHGAQLHLRRVVREAARHGGVPVRLHWQRRKIKQRPLVLIADISGSMERYARLLLQFLYSVARRLAQVECFVFGTRLTRITQQLKLRNIDTAIDEAAREIVDWAGGTRIGASLHTFNRHWARRVLGRGAVVLLISDGWDRGPSENLAKEMRLLQKRCHRLIWLNPLLGASEYQPRVAGMAAALPYIDDFLPIHNLQSLHALAERLENV
jgi:uncharacterized protein